jgi:hypothetical protein
MNHKNNCSGGFGSRLLKAVCEVLFAENAGSFQRVNFGAWKRRRQSGVQFAPNKDGHLQNMKEAL